MKQGLVPDHISNILVLKQPVINLLNDSVFVGKNAFSVHSVSNPPLLNGLIQICIHYRTRRENKKKLDV